MESASSLLPLKETLKPQIESVSHYDYKTAEKLKRIFNDLPCRTHDKPPKEFYKEIATRFVTLCDQDLLENNIMLREFYQILSIAMQKIFMDGGEKFFHIRAEGLKNKYLIPGRLLSLQCPAYSHVVEDLDLQDHVFNLDDYLEIIEGEPDQQQLLDTFCRYLTQQSFRINETNVEGLMKLAFYWECQELMNACIHWWVENLNEKNLLDLLKKASTYFSRRLIDHISQFICQNSFSPEDLSKIWIAAEKEKLALLQMACLKKASPGVEKMPDSLKNAYSDWKELLGLVTLERGIVNIDIYETNIKLTRKLIKTSFFAEQSSWYQTALHYRFRDYIFGEFNPKSLEGNSLVTGIDTSGISYAPECIEKLSDAIEGNRKLESINLQKIQLFHQSAVKMLRTLIQNPNLKELDLSINSFTFIGLLPVLEKLRNHPSIQKLNLAGTFLSPPLERLNAGTREDYLLSLHDAKVRNEILKRNLEAAPPLDCKETAIREIEEILTFQGPVSLSQALKGNHVLKELVLDSNYLSDDSSAIILKALKVNQTLSRLSLRSNALGIKSAEILQKVLPENRGLKTLHLSSNCLSSEFAEVFATGLLTNRTLQYIFLSDNRLGDRGVAALVEALKSNPKVLLLGLEKNHIGSEGAKSLASLIASNHPMTLLNLKENPIGDEGGLAIQKALESNTHRIELNLQDCEIPSEKLIDELAKDNRVKINKKESRNCTIS